MRVQKYTFDEKTIRYRHNLKLLTKFLKKHIYLIVAAMAIWCYFYGLMDGWRGTFSDADGYMRALRVYHFVLNPSFLEQPIYESNYPFGEILHWTRPMDILWVLFMLPFSFSHELHEAVFLSGAFIAPVLGCLATIVLAYGLRRAFNIYLAIFGCFLFLYDPQVVAFILPEKPDHHALMMLLSIYSFSLILCWLKKRQNRYLRLIGITLALSAFTAIEGMILYAIFLSFFLYLYTFKNVSLLPVVKIAKYFALSLTCFWLLNPPYQGLFYPDNGRISVLYVIASWLAFFGFYILNVSHLHTARIKLLCLWSTALGFLLVLIALFGPNIMSSPLDKDISVAFVNRISEMRSGWTGGIFFFMSLWAFPLVALLLNVYMLKFYPYRRLMIFNLCIGLPIFLLSLWAVRFVNYESLYTVLPFLAFLDYIYKKSDYARNKNYEFPGYIYGLILLILAVQTMVHMPYSVQYMKRKNVVLFDAEICQNVQKIGGTLSTDIFESVRYVWDCDVNTVSTPYHRNHEGIVDNHKLLYSETTAEALPIIYKHQISQILLFTDYERHYYSLDEENKNKLYYRILKGENVPPFLERVPLFSPNARLYKVKL